MCVLCACVQGTDLEWAIRVGQYNRLAKVAPSQPRMAAGLASSGMLALMLQDAAALEGRDTNIAELVRPAAWRLCIDDMVWCVGDEV
jgi:hypothetical protein